MNIFILMACFQMASLSGNVQLKINTYISQTQAGKHDTPTAISFHNWSMSKIKRLILKLNFTHWVTFLTLILGLTTASAQSVRISSSWFTTSKDSTTCISSARQAMKSLGYQGIMNSQYSVFAGTNNLTAAVRCDLPGKVLVIFAYNEEPTQSEQDEDQSRLTDLLSALR